MSKFWVLLPLFLPLAACGQDEINRLLNGSPANADNTGRIRYVPGGAATPEEITRSSYYAPGQSTSAMRRVFGSPDSYDRNYDYYDKGDGSMLAVPYNESGRWTGELNTVPAPSVQPSAYPGAQ